MVGVVGKGGGGGGGGKNDYRTIVNIIKEASSSSNNQNQSSLSQPHDNTLALAGHDEISLHHMQLQKSYTVPTCMVQVWYSMVWYTFR